MKWLPVALGMLGLLNACATSRPDHFYILSAQPAGESAARTTPAQQAVLTVTLPSVVDRSEIVLSTSAEGIAVLEHERWAAPLPDLFVQTLGQDIELRRADVAVGGHHLGGPASGVIRISVDVVQVAVQRGHRASIEAHWRIVDASRTTDLTGSGSFSAPMAGDDYAAVASALSQCIAKFADRLAADLPHLE